jgi:hypothetical protein
MPSTALVPSVTGPRACAVVVVVTDVDSRVRESASLHALTRRAEGSTIAATPIRRFPRI